MKQLRDKPSNKYIKNKNRQCEICGTALRVKKEHYACTGWTVEDILAGAERCDVELNEEEALDLLENGGLVADIVDAMVAEGWNVIEEHISMLKRERRDRTREV